jgi:anti-sigma regulatory factor (Ser/Thr protein kinase)
MGTSSDALQLPSTPEAPARARQYVHEVGSALPPDLLDTLQLVVSEAVTNAVRYGQGRLEIRLTVSDSTVRVEVSDANPEPPARRPLPPSGLPEGGLGLHLLDALTQAWGADSRHDPPGKTIWLQLPIPP